MFHVEHLYCEIHCLSYEVQDEFMLSGTVTLRRRNNKARFNVSRGTLNRALKRVLLEGWG